MTDRTVKVTLLAQATGFITGMDQAARKTRETGSELEKLAQKRQSFERLGRAALGFGIAVGVGIAGAVASFADFDQSMSYVQASTHETASNMGLLRDAALEAGAATVFSATESANAIDELAKAGISTTDIIGGALTGSLDLAAAGGLGVARAAEISATTLQQYSLAGTEASHVSDVLAAGAGKAMGSVDDLAQGLKFVGPVAASMGISLEQTTGVLALFAQQGIIGEQAGTSLRGVLSSLTSPSAQARKEIERLGIQLYDSEGKFLGLQNAAGQLNRVYAEMDDASRQASLGIVFGRETITAATALYSAGAQGVADWTAQVDDSGYAAETARLRLDNLKGDVEKLGGAFDTALIKGGSSANDVLRDLVQGVTWLVDGVGQLPQPVTDAGMAVGTLGGGIVLAAGAALTFVPKIAEMNDALKTLDINGKAAARTTVGLGLAAGGIALGATMVIDYFSQMAQSASAYAETLDDTTGAMTNYSRELISKKLAESGAYDAAANEGINQKKLLDAVMAGGDEYTKLLDKIRGRNNIVDFFNGSGIAAGNATDAIRAARTSVEQGTDQYRDMQAAQTDLEESSEGAAEGIEQVAASTELATTNLTELSDAIRGYDDATSNAIKTTADFYQSIDDAKEAFGAEGFAATLDLTTQAGRDNSAALLEIADAANELAATTYETSGSQDELMAKVNEGRQALFDQARQFFDTDEAAWGYVDQLLQTPEQISTQINLNGIAEATARLDEFMANYEGRLINIKVNATNPSTSFGLGDGGINAGSDVNENANGGLYSYANGGFATGIYSGRNGAIHKFAEPETQWEAYISGRPGQESRNVGIWAEAGRRLGAIQTAPDYMRSPGSSAGSSTSVNNSWNIQAPAGPSAEVIGKSLAATVVRKQRRSFG
jgi:TP901 family phage tail tape measure protein